MADTRIDGTSRTAPECDDETLVCGAEKKAEPQVSKPEPQVSNPDETWHTPMLPEDKPSHVAEIAKNMSTPKPTPQARDESKSAEPGAVVTHPVARVGTTEVFGLEGELAFHKGDNVTVLDGDLKVGVDHFGPSGAVVHGEVKKNIGGVDVRASVDGGGVEYGPGITNKDGSTGLHVGGTATTVGAELDVHKPGVGSVTVGVSGGQAAAVSVGGKKEGATYEACARVDWSMFTVGACFPVWRGRN